MKDRSVQVVGTTMRMTFYQNVFDGFIIFTILIQPLMVALLALWMLRGRGPDYGIYVVVGGGMAGLWSSLLFISGHAITHERWFGTLETLTGVPTPLQWVVLGKTFAQVIQSLISMVATYVMASLILGYPLSVASPILFLVSLVLTIVAFIAFGLIIAPLFVLNPMIAQWTNGLEFPVYFLSAFLFPVLMLPGWSRPFSWALPTYWAARALHMSAEGTGNFREIAFTWIILGITSLVFLAFSRGLFSAVIRRAKTVGTLDAR